MAAAMLSTWFSVALGRVSYEFFTDRSGLPDGRFAMLVYVVGTVSSSHSPHSGMGRTSHAPFYRPWLSSS